MCVCVCMRESNYQCSSRTHTGLQSYLTPRRQRESRTLGWLRLSCPRRPRCDLDPEVMWYLLAKLMDWKTQGLLTPEQFENAKVALSL